MNKRIYIETYGCQMNEADTEIIRTILKEQNFNFVNNEKDADIVLLNTCTVRDNADRKEINRVKFLKYKYPHLLIGVLGCLATNMKDNLLDDKWKVDFHAGPDSYRKLPDIIKNVYETGKKEFDTTLSDYETYSEIYPSRVDNFNACIAIMRGCNNYCSYCIVPYVRGRERSRDYKSIIKEIKKLVLDGCSQITLLGQNVNSYDFEEKNFTDLIKMISDIGGIKRIRFMSPHPKDLSQELINIMAERDNICNHIHLPLQAGNNRILKMMNRTYTKEKFCDLVEYIRSLIPDIVITTDIIIGFPTETESEYLDTLDVVKKVRFDSAFIFKYSPRAHTKAAENYPDDVSEQEKKRRIIEINEIQREISFQKNKNHIDEIQEIIVSQKGTKKDKNKYQGRNEGNKLVIFPAANCEVGDYVKVKITSATTNILKGVIET
jgi:tRNA-2-methylthio-N6-dimethylallyladenosine synthase